jgi:hypothetical protein
MRSNNEDGPCEAEEVVDTAVSERVEISDGEVFDGGDGLSRKRLKILE